MKKHFFMMALMSIGISVFAQNTERPKKDPEQRVIERTKQMQKNLGLSDEQYEKLLTINLEAQKQRKELREKQREMLKTERQALMQKYEAILSSEQMAKLKQNAKAKREELRQRNRRGK